jgi:AcrR family transcriptional regulator
MGRARVHTEETALALLDAAERVIDAEGVAALTVRRVADELGATTRAVYSTFGSKQALLTGLGIRAFDLLGARVAGMPATADAVEDLVAAGAVAYREFALQRPALHQIAFGDAAADLWPQMAPAANRALQSLIALVQRVEANGGLRDLSVPDAIVQFQCLCDGLVINERRGVLGPPAQAAHDWQRALNTLVAGWTLTGTNGSALGPVDSLG